MPSAIHSRESSELAKIDSLSDKQKNKLSFTASKQSPLTQKNKAQQVNEKEEEFQSFFRYLRINEIQV